MRLGELSDDICNRLDSNNVKLKAKLCVCLIKHVMSADGKVEGGGATRITDLGTG
jgi:hypothetical protein